jgi:2,3-dihydroxyphenylpropionate 1,2-dioxygenase
VGEVVLGVGASHSTLMNTHWDQVHDIDGARRFRTALRVARDEIAAAQPDVAVIIGSNHFRGIWLDLVPSFALGVGEVISSGEARTPKGPQRTDPEFAQRLATGLVHRGTEVAISARMQIDHGQSHAIQYLLDEIHIPVVPLMVNVFAAPLPLLSRCAELGRNLALAVCDDDDNRRVVVIASGGLSHRLPWPSRWNDPHNEDEEFLVEAWLNGRGDWERYDARRREIITAARPVIFEDFDAEFLGSLETGDLDHYLPWTSDQLEDAAGNGGQELRTWLTMAAALGFVPGRRLAYAAMPEWLTGMAVAVLDPAVACV